MSDLLYAYAVVRDGHGTLPGALRGVAAGPVRTVGHEGLAAVVGPVPAADFEEEPLRTRLEDLSWLEATARAHQEVVDAAAALGTVLPLRLATVYRDEEGVRRMLREGRERLTATLDRLEGRIEWGVKVYAEPVEPAAAAPAATGAVPRSGREYLLQRRRARQSRDEAWRQADEVARRLHQALAGCAEAARLHPPQDGRLAPGPGRNVLNAAYLVPREEAEAFAARAGDATAPGVRVELTGPWAPYSFVAETAGEATGETAGENAAEAAEEVPGKAGAS